MIKSRGARIDPCGTPENTGNDFSIYNHSLLSVVKKVVPPATGGYGTTCLRTFTTVSQFFILNPSLIILFNTFNVILY